MNRQPFIIAAYPRSGSTWMRFILCNLFYPEIEHDFNTVNRRIPPIDHAPGLMEGINQPYFYKSHSKHTATNIIFLHRHVGDVLVSAWWYSKKMNDDKRSLEEYIIATQYGAEWRDYVDFYFPAVINISYEDLGKADTYLTFCLRMPNDITAAINKSSIEKMRELEKGDTGIYPMGNPDIPFCRNGMSGECSELPKEIRIKLFEQNQTQLKKLGYLH